MDEKIISVHAIHMIKVLYEQKFKDIAVSRYEENDKFFMSLFSDGAKLKFIMDMMEKIVYDDLKKRT